MVTTHHPVLNPEFIMDRQGGYCDAVDHLDREVRDPLLQEKHLSRGAVGLDVTSLVEGPSTRIVPADTIRCA